MYDSETEGVDFVSEITDTDIKKHYNNKIKLTATYNISVYATKKAIRIQRWQRYTFLLIIRHVTSLNKQKTAQKFLVLPSLPIIFAKNA